MRCQSGLIGPGRHLPEALLHLGLLLQLRLDLPRRVDLAFHIRHVAVGRDGINHPLELCHPPLHLLHRVAAARLHLRRETLLADVDLAHPLPCPVGPHMRLALHGRRVHGHGARPLQLHLLL